MVEQHPKYPHEITPEWLTHVLRDQGLLTDSCVKTIKVDKMAQGKAWLSEIVRIEVEYDIPDNSAPSSFIIKMLSESRKFREFSYEMNAFEREIRFYQEIASKISIRLPKLFYSLSGYHGNLMIMEDMSYLTPGDQIVGMSHDQILATLTSLGKIHAGCWNDSMLTSLSWIPTTNKIEEDYVENWDSFVGLCSDFIDTDGLKIGAKLKPRTNWLFEEISKRPKTLTHDDMKADNLLFGEPGTAEAVVILDWQFAIRSMGIADVARLIGGSQTPSVRTGHQFEALRHWCDILIENGVKDFSWDEAQRDFKLGALSCLAFPVHFHKGITRAEGRALDYVKALYSRLFSFVVEIEADSILP